MSVNATEPSSDSILPPTNMNGDHLDADQSESFLDISPYVKEYIENPVATPNPPSETGFFSDSKMQISDTLPNPDVAVNGANPLINQRRVELNNAKLDIKVEFVSSESGQNLMPTEDGICLSPQDEMLMNPNVGAEFLLKAEDENLSGLEEDVFNSLSKTSKQQCEEPSKVSTPLSLGQEETATQMFYQRKLEVNFQNLDESQKQEPFQIFKGESSLIHSGSTEINAQSHLKDELKTETCVHMPNVHLLPSENLWTTKRNGSVKLRITKSGPGSEAPMTIHQCFLDSVERYKEMPALAYKKDGKWEMINYSNYYEECRKAAKSFLRIGLERFHGVGILGFNSPEWFISDIAAIFAGGFAVGIYTTNSPEACHYVAHNCEANILMVENHKQLTKILQVQDQLPHLKAIVQWGEEVKEKRPNLYSWKEFMDLGKEVPDAQLDEVLNLQKANQCCTLIYTSGTTGNPKGVMLSHDNLTWIANTAGLEVGLKAGCGDCLISYLPLSHVAAQVNDLWIAMRFGGTTYFADPDALKGSLINTMRDVRPTAFLGVPRVWEKMQEKMKSVGSKSSLLKRMVADWAKQIGLQASYNSMNGNAAVPWGYMLANSLVFKKVREALGLDRCTRCFTGAAPITKDTLEYFMSLNISLLELYGMSESTGPHTISTAEAFRIMSCGKEILGCQTKLDKPDAEGNGEVCFWGRHVFMGYLHSEEKTKEAIDSEGWLHSGDLGRHDEDGFLYITGRIKELLITAGGENIPPVPIEDSVKEEIPIISNAMLIGDKRKFLSMLLTLKCNVNDSGEPLDELTHEVKEFCRLLGCNAHRVSDIAGQDNHPVYKAIQEGIDRVNAKATSNAQKIQKWLLLERDFSVPGGELGPTMKLKRPVVQKMYKEKIDEFYTD
ncbi:long-chain-fatty-acid--CoA ligase ACSBG2-like [Erpetoichthys calabaricus]|uniref:long-chain-fatty-acid--CoA ligase n=1 Tax=Erpetoichthys calabaricus TaxID=27687 RepID=A0A8C4XEF8_ERPCA|nr:long-chain-fatty-acid--CoA ligase ACSBG2-like [Erpetoichthys calabaricus]XP_028660768.1 long-chain-fatty-acid--CoA ligase ACSBG2-like [Erpetoichthys calabaricus]XP_028660769.1 long-chain-fatty-acid--CoA ligase ACSBG2-like [Erpetoichthys calabaricus]